MVKLRAVVSARVSHLTDESTSASSQHVNAEAKAAALGAVVVGRPADLDVSAFRVPPMDRPELGAWLRRPEDFDVLIVRSIDRLCRRVADLDWIIRWAKDNAVRLVFLDQDLDLGTPFGVAVAQILGVVAELESGMISTRVTIGRRFMRSVARWPAGPPSYGYRTCPHPSGKGLALEVDPETGPIMRDIVARVIAGERVSSVARGLNRDGVLSPQGMARKRAGRPIGTVLWSGTHVARMLGRGGNDALRGLVWEVGEGAGRVPVLGDDGVQLRYAAEPLVDDATWRQLQVELAKTQADPTREVHGGDPMKGVLFCAECRFPMYRQPRKVDGGVYFRYVCLSGYKKASGCSGAGVNLEDAWPVLERAWLREVGDWRVMIRHDEPGVDHSAEISDVEKSLSELEDDRAFRGLYKGERGVERYSKLHTRLSARLDWLVGQPSKAASVRWEDSGLTYRDEWNASEGDAAAASLRGRAVFWVRGKNVDGPASERISWDAGEWGVVNARKPLTPGVSG